MMASLTLVFFLSGVAPGESVDRCAGAATSVFAATAPELAGRGGLYLENCHVVEINDAPDALDGVKSYALDPGNAERLWAVSEQLVGETPPMPGDIAKPRLMRRLVLGVTL